MECYWFNFWIMYLGWGLGLGVSNSDSNEALASWGLTMFIIVDVNIVFVIRTIFRICGVGMDRCVGMDRGVEIALGSVVS